MNRQQLKNLEKFAEQELNYTGKEENYIGDDEEYEFGGGSNANSFIQELSPNRTFQFQIVNQFATQKKLALSPGLFTTVAEMVAAGFPVDAIIGDGDLIDEGGTKLTLAASGSGQSAGFLREYFKSNPMRVVAISMTSNKESQFEQSISMENLSPFSKLGSRPLLLTQYRPAGQLNRDKIEANLLQTRNVIELNDQNVVILPIEPEATLSIILYIGTIDNSAARLHNKAEKAHNNIQMKYPEKYIGG